MQLYYLGFNGFKQFAPVCLERVEGGERVRPLFISEFWNCLDISISWSKLCCIAGNGTLIIHSEANCEYISPEKVRFLKVACSNLHLGTITAEGDGKLYAFRKRELKEIFSVTAGKDRHFTKCYIGESDALFVNDVGRVIWISLIIQPLECSSLPIAWKVVSAACGKEHVLLLTESGIVYAFGKGSRGQLGHGGLDSEESPRCVECLEGISVCAIAAGGWHSAAVTPHGDLYTWGWNESGQLGFPTPREHQDGEGIVLQATPMCVEFPEGVNVQSVSCGSRHTLITTGESTVLAFGWNSYGQLGSTSPSFSSKPMEVKFFSTNKLKVNGIWSAGWSSLVEATPLSQSSTENKG